MLRTLSRSTSQRSTVTQKYRVLVIGGGSGGISVASQLAMQHLDQLKSGMIVESKHTGIEEMPYEAVVGVIDPSEYHYYQPLWTLVGAGIKKFEESRKPMNKIWEDISDINDGLRVKMIDTKAMLIKPEENTVLTPGGSQIKYDYLVVAPGIECKWDCIKGLSEAIADPYSKITSNYHPEAVQRTSKLIKDIQEQVSKTGKPAKAIFTQPSTPIKCAGAPQKIMYLAEEQWRHARLRDKISVSFYTGAPKIFSVEKYAHELSEICKKRDINVHLSNELVEIDNKTQTAVFKNLQSGASVETKFDFLHVTPHMSPPKFIRESGLGNDVGYCNVNHHSLQHVKFKNIFSLGDAASLPISKTASAVAAQTKIVVGNLLKQVEADGKGTPGSHKPTSDLLSYSGYTACPLVTGRTSLIMAEFNGFTFEPRETFWFDQGKESMLLSVVKTEMLPIIYWNVMMRGNWDPEVFRRFLNPKNRD